MQGSDLVSELPGSQSNCEHALKQALSRPTRTPQNPDDLLPIPWWHGHRRTTPEGAHEEMVKRVKAGGVLAVHLTRRALIP